MCRFNEKRSRYYEKRSRYYEKIWRFNEKRSRFNEKRSRFKEKRSRYNDIIEWKKYYVWAVLRHRNFTLKIFENYNFFYEDWTNKILSPENLGGGGGVFLISKIKTV